MTGMGVSGGGGRGMRPTLCLKQKEENKEKRPGVDPTVMAVSSALWPSYGPPPVVSVLLIRSLCLH